MTASLGGLDALVFTGGVGGASPAIHERACNGLGYLGDSVDPAANRALAAGGDAVISADAAVAVLALTTREDREIARQVRAALRHA